MPLLWLTETLPISTSTGFAVPGASVSSTTGSPAFAQWPAVPIAYELPLRKTKFIVQPAGESIHEPGRMPTSPGSGASVGAATGTPFAASTRAASAGVYQDGVSASQRDGPTAAAVGQRARDP